MNGHQVNVLGTWVAILTVVIGGSMWVGALGSDNATNKVAIQENTQQIDKLRDSVPPAISELKSQVQQLQRDISEIKQSQAEILKELRKK